MPLRKLIFKVTPELAGQRLDQFLAVVLPPALGVPLSKAKVRKLIMAGAVYLNRGRIRIASKIMRPNAQVEAYVDLQKLQHDATSQDQIFNMSTDRVIFEDEFLIVVDKPPGLPTQPTIDEARNNLYTAVQEFLAKREGVIKPYLGLHQRLDRDTSGVILFTKQPAANGGIAEAFAKHTIVKVYQTLAFKANSRTPANNWRVTNYLGRAANSRGKQAKYTAVTEAQGDWAQTDFTLKENLGEILWLEAQPQTGRTHQIRVHLAGQDMPILGDILYGKTIANKVNIKDSVVIPRLMLHAFSLTLTHPISQQVLTWQSPLPKDFKTCLSAYQRLAER